MPPSATIDFYDKIVDMLERTKMSDHPVISMRDLNFNNILNETVSTNPIKYIDTAYGMQHLFSYFKVPMVLHPIIWVIMSVCSLIYMGMIQEVLQIWIYIYIYHGAPRYFWMRVVFIMK